MLPDIIENTNFKYIKVDNKYVISLCFKALPENIYFLDIVKDLPQTLNYDFSIYVSKLDIMKTLNDITLNIGYINGELDTANLNQRNIDVINKSKEESTLLRRKIQTENQEIYNVSFILTFYSNDLNELVKNISSIKAKLYSKGINSEITNFRHLEFYLSNLPLNIRNSFLNKIYITTDALSNIFPFYSNNFIDERGVIIGKTENNKMCIIDIFSPKYENSNICVFGCSGSGKSYFIKLFIIKNYFMKKRQIVFDCEGEYEEICTNLEGQILFKDTYFNILEIGSKDLENENYLKTKVDKIVTFLSMFSDIDKSYITKKLYELYARFGITEDIESLYKTYEDESIYLDYEIKESMYFPTLEDLILEIENEEQKRILTELVNGELKCFSRKTNIDTNSTFIVLNMKKIINYPKILTLIIQYILDNYLGDEQTIIYIDEMWKYAKDEEVFNGIFNMYKTIRKRNAAIVTVTQDITDLFEYKDGMYANTILNNSCFKFFFKMNQRDGKRLIKDSNIDETKMSFLKKGETILSINRNNLKLNIIANDFEREVINEVDNVDK